MKTRKLSANGVNCAITYRGDTIHMAKSRVQVNGRNFISQCGRLACVKERANLVSGQKRWFAYRVGEHKPEHRFQSYANAVEWLATLDGRGYLTIDGVMVMRNWK